MTEQVHVAVGVVVNARQQVLIALRADHQHQGGLWEFPGGKVELGEPVQQALARELKEELGVVVQTSQPLVIVEHDYGDKKVVLDTWLVTKFEGEPEGMENQSIRWVAIAALPDYTFPKANDAIVEKILSVSRQQQLTG